METLGAKMEPETDKKKYLKIYIETITNSNHNVEEFRVALRRQHVIKHHKNNVNIDVFMRSHSLAKLMNK